MIHPLQGSSRPAKTVVSAIALLLVVAALSGCGGVQPESATTTTSIAGTRDYPEAPLLDQVVQCMEDQGWEVIVDWQGGYSGPEMSSELSSQWIAASNECAEQAGYFDPKLTEGQIRELYRQEVKTHQCIVALNAPSDEPPSEQVYVDTFGTGEQYYAISAVLTAQLPEVQQIAQQCVPPTWFLNVAGL